MHAVQLAKRIFRAGTIIAVDRFDWKLEQAMKLGATGTVNAKTKGVADALAGMTNGRFGDVVLDFVGSEETNQQGLDCVGKGGKLVLVGIGARSMTISPYMTIIGKEMEIVGVDDHLKTELTQLVSFAKSGRIDLSHSVTHKVRLQEINEGLRILEDENEKPIRVVVSNGN